MVPLFTKPSCLDGSCWGPFTDTVGKREVSWASHNLAAEGINTEVTAKYPVRDHLYSAGLRGLLLLGCDLEQSSSDTVCEKVHLYYTLNVTTCIQDPLFQSLELFLAITPSGESLLVHGVFLDGGLVGEIPSCSRMRGILHWPGMTEDFYMSKNSYQNYLLCQSTRPGLVLAEESQGTFNSPCLEECMCVRSWICHLSALVQY